MKAFALILAALLLVCASPSAWADPELVEIELPKVKVPAAVAAQPDSMFLFRIGPDGALGAVDVGELGRAIAAKTAESEWTGFHPVKAWRNNVQPMVYIKRHWKGVLVATGTAIVGGITYAVVEHNQGGGGSSSRAAEKGEAEAVAEQLPAGTTVAGDLYVFTASGDYSSIDVSQSYSAGAAQ